MYPLQWVKKRRVQPGPACWEKRVRNLTLNKIDVIALVKGETLLSGHLGNDRVIFPFRIDHRVQEYLASGTCVSAILIIAKFINDEDCRR